MEIFGGMDDEILDPIGGIWVANGLDVIWGGSEKVALLDAIGGFGGAEK